MSPRSVRIQRAKDTKVKDKFSLKKWNAGRRKILGKYRPYKDQAAVMDRRTVRFLIDADKDAGSRDGFASQNIIASDSKNIKKVKKLDLWTDLGKTAPVSTLGTLRSVFGGTFVKIANLVHKVRSRIQGALEKRRSKPKPNSYGAVAILAIWRAAVAILTPVFRSTVAVLAESLRMGAKKKLEPKLKGLIDPDKLQEKAAEQFPEVTAVKDKLTTVREQIDQKVADFQKNFGTELDKLKGLSDQAKTVGTVIKVAMIAVQCATPPGWGCLKLLASTAIARLANKIMQWCSVQKKFQELALKLDVLRTMPKTLAGKFRSAMPDEVKEFFAEEPIKNIKEAKAVGCSENGNEKGHPKGSTEPTEEQKAYAQLMTDLGCEEDRESSGCDKFRALVDLLKKKGVGKGMKAEDILKLGPLLKNPDLKARDIREVARVAKGGKKTKVEDLLKNLPKEIRDAKGRTARVVAVNKLFPRGNKSAKQQLKEIGKKLKRGNAQYDRSSFTPGAMASGGMANVAVVAHTNTNDGKLVAGTIDIKFVSKFTCSKAAKHVTIKADKILLSNARLFDEKGKAGEFGLEGMEGDLSFGITKEEFAPYKKLCP